MKHKLWKKLSVALVSVMALTSCRLIDNIVNRVLLTVADQLPFLVNVIDLMGLQDGEGGDLPISQFEEAPLTKNKRANIEYIKNALLIPKKLEVEGIPYNLEFSIPEGIAGFHEFVLSNEDLPADFQEEIPLQIEVYVLIPVGTSTILGNASSLEDLEGVISDTSQTELASAANQASMEIELPITIRAGANHTKTKNFYLKLVKAEFGALIVDVVFESEFLLNVFDAVNDEITSLDEKPLEPHESVKLEYFKETLAIPKSIEIEDIGTVDFEVTTNFPHMFFANEMEKSIEELDPDNEDFSGNVEIYTFTPIGDNVIPGTVQTIDDFKDYVQDTLGPKDLYNKATTQLDNHLVEFTVKAFSGESEEPLREETYYFSLMNARLEQEIVDYVMDETDFIVNIINYKDIEDPKKLDHIPDTPAKAADVEYLTETIVIPKQVDLPDFGNNTLYFDTEITYKDTEIFESSRNAELDSDEVSDVVVTTLTPLATFVPAAANIDDLATEIEGLSSKQLFNYATHASSTLEITVTAKMHDADGEWKTNTKTYYFNLIEANVDEQIADHIIGENGLINIVDYEDVDDIASIASSAKDPLNRYQVEHLKETLLIPDKITLPEYGNKVITVAADVVRADGHAFFETIESRVITEGSETFDLDVKTLTPLGSYVAQGANTLEELADELKDTLSTKELYDHSQAANVNVDITLTLNLGDEERVETYYFELIKADFDEKISEALMDENVLYVGGYDFTKAAVPASAKSHLTPHEIEYLRDTILVPTVFNPVDYPEKTFEFVLEFDELDRMNDDKTLFFEGTKADIEHEGNLVTVTGLLPHAGFSKIDPNAELEDLLNYLDNLFNHPDPFNPEYIADAQALGDHLATLNNNLAYGITVTPKIDGKLFSAYAATYYFDIVKPTL